MSKHKQLLFLFFHELRYTIFFVLLQGMVRCLFVSIFANFSRLYWPTTFARNQVFLLIVCTTGVTILRIFFESDKYLCPLTVSFKFPTPRDKHVPFEAKIFPTPEEFETGPPLSFFNNALINVKLARGRGMGHGVVFLVLLTGAPNYLRGCLSKNRPLNFTWKIILPETLATERLYRDYN